MKTLKHALRNRQAGISRTQAIWIWFWYNDIVRFILPLFGLHLVLTLAGLHFTGLLTVLESETIKGILIAQYLFVFLWALADNDYTQLNKIGLTTERYLILKNPPP